MILTPSGKHEVIREYARELSAEVFVETGTYFGETIEAVRDCFKDVYSIELSLTLHELARKKFEGDPRVHLFQGDSGLVLPSILSFIKRKCVFWLDAHYSCGVTARGETDTPITRELSAALSPGTQGIVLIDDARLFDGTNSYPTLLDVQEFVEWRGRVFELRDDIIRVRAV